MNISPVNNYSSPVSFGSKQAKYSEKTPVRFASAPEIASAEYDAIKVSGAKLPHISGAAKIKAHPERYKNILSHTEEGNRYFDKTNKYLGISCNSTLGEYRKALIKFYRATIEPSFSNLRKSLL